MLMPRTLKQRPIRVVRRNPINVSVPKQKQVKIPFRAPRITRPQI